MSDILKSYSEVCKTALAVLDQSMRGNEALRVVELLGQYGATLLLGASVGKKSEGAQLELPFSQGSAS